MNNLLFSNETSRSSSRIPAISTRTMYASSVSYSSVGGLHTLERTCQLTACRISRRDSNKVELVFRMIAGIVQLLLMRSYRSVLSTPGGIRTHNLLLRRQLLCPLSYGGNLCYSLECVIDGLTSKGLNPRYTRGPAIVLRMVSAGRPSFLARSRSEEHTSELQSRLHLVYRLLLDN